MNPLHRICLLLALCLSSGVSTGVVFGDISLPKYFSDNMVLQQNRSMRVWGKSDPKEKLTITFKEMNVAAVADIKGNWAVNIQTGPAGGPYQLQVASETNETKVLFSNVMVGEVWVCGGEDNTNIPVSATQFAEADIAAAKNFPRIRVFQVDQTAANKPLSDFSKVNPWYCCSSETIKEFSAIAYFYARELSAKLDVPIGVIQLTGGPVPLESWIPEIALKEAQFDSLLEHWSNQNEPSNPNAVAGLFNGMVSPLAQTPIGGVVWYHGTSNIGRGAQYARLFPLVIDSWRDHFKSNDLPFYFVQPSPFRFEYQANDALPEIWDAQLRTFKNTSNTGVVVTTDLMEPQLTHNKHKLTIAKRLSSWAFTKCYFATPIQQQAPAKSASASATDDKGAEPPEPDSQALNGESGNSRRPAVQAPEKQDESKSSKPPAPAPRLPLSTTTSAPKVDDGVKFVDDVVILPCSGPIYDSAAVEVENKQITISFRFAESGLKLNQEFDHGFTICGEDKQFLPAQIRVKGTEIVVFHADIGKPLAVRYGWTDTSQPALTNASGLPASPFRTDDFPLPSAGIEF